jgi:hypothetical protein
MPLAHEGPEKWGCNNVPRTPSWPVTEAAGGGKDARRSEIACFRAFSHRSASVFATLPGTPPSRAGTTRQLPVPATAAVRAGGLCIGRVRPPAGLKHRPHELSLPLGNRGQRSRSELGRQGDEPKAGGLGGPRCSANPANGMVPRFMALPSEGQPLSPFSQSSYQNESGVRGLPRRPREAQQTQTPLRPILPRTEDNGAGSGKDKMPLRLPTPLSSLASPTGGVGLATLPPDLQETLLTCLCPAAKPPAPWQKASLTPFSLHGLHGLHGHHHRPRRGSFEIHRYRSWRRCYW